LLLQGMMSKLGALAAGAAIFLGGYTTGIASSSMVDDLRIAEMHRQEMTAPAPASLPVKPVSLALPDQVGYCSSIRWAYMVAAAAYNVQQHILCCSICWAEASEGKSGGQTAALRRDSPQLRQPA
jgi:hypothetical protein